MPRLSTDALWLCQDRSACFWASLAWCSLVLVYTLVTRVANEHNRLSATMAPPAHQLDVHWCQAWDANLAFCGASRMRV